MYAIVKSGGKQLKVAQGDIILVEKLAADVGDTVQLDQVLLLADGETVTVGSPLIAGAAVAAKVVEQTRGDKIIVFKKKRRQNYRRKNGHRQLLTKIEITQIAGKGAVKPKAAAPVTAPVTQTEEN